jgi:thiamine-phosphate pyrophosphorylase
VLPAIGRLDPGALRLVAITDSLRDGVDGLVARAAAAVEGGATMLQLRLMDETARTLVEVARALRRAVPSVPLLLNDRADVALAADADGVHVGNDDLAPASLRRVVPARFIIGVSVGAAEEVARARGADYVAIGPVFAAGGAVDAGVAIGVARFSELARLCGVPAVAVGGISPENAASVLAAGASGVAVISALFGASDPRVAARAFRSVLGAIES